MKEPGNVKRPRTSSRKSRPNAAPARAPTYDDLLAIARLIESGSRFSEFRLRSGDIEVEVKRANGTPQSVVAAAQSVIPAPRARLDPGSSSSRTSESGTPGITKELPASGTAIPPGAHIIKSPMVGTFYRSPEPGAPPFVEEGARVEPDTIVCIIEVMKLMNSVTAGVRGIVTHVLVENAHMVEFGQPIVAIVPE